MFWKDSDYKLKSCLSVFSKCFSNEQAEDNQALVLIFFSVMCFIKPQYVNHESYIGTAFERVRESSILKDGYKKEQQYVQPRAKVFLGGFTSPSSNSSLLSKPQPIFIWSHGIPKKIIYCHCAHKISHMVSVSSYYIWSDYKDQLRNWMFQLWIIIISYLASE